MSEPKISKTNVNHNCLELACDANSHRADDVCLKPVHSINMPVNAWENLI